MQGITMNATNVISLNGKVTDTDTFPLNRGFLYGDGFFESFRMYQGKIAFWKHHTARIKNAALALKIDVTANVINSIEEAIYALYQSHGTDKQYRGRITVFRHGAGLYAPDSNQPEFVVQLMQIDHEKFVLNKDGLLVDLFHGIPKPVNALSSFKTLNALPFVLAGIEKKERGLDEVLILNSHNRLCESSTSNVFCVKGDQIITP
jgi:branched-chain amino acid aminotransferase